MSNYREWSIIQNMNYVQNIEAGDEVRILMVEDHISLREALTLILEKEPGFTVVGQAGSLSEAREFLGIEPVDVAVLDLGLPDGDGAELIREIQQSVPALSCAVLVLTMSLDQTHVARAVEAGASGVLHKSVSITEIVGAIKRLRSGETLFTATELVSLLRLASSRREEVLATQAAIKMLTPREREVLQGLSEGLDSREIAYRMKIAVETERNYAASILGKLGVHSRLQALAFAIRNGIVQVNSASRFNDGSGKPETNIPA